MEINNFEGRFTNIEGKVENLNGVLEKMIEVSQNQLSTANNFSNDMDMIHKRLLTNENVLKAVLKDNENLNSTVTNLDFRMTNIEENEEITTEQCTKINSKIKSRVYDILDMPQDNKYYRTFITNLYSYLRRNHNLASPYRRTRKRHYDEVMKGIDTWYPEVKALKQQKDLKDLHR